MSDILRQYLNILIELKIYPFAPLEINFIINFFWIVLKGLFKSTSDYREAKKLTSFFQVKVLTFLFSFLIMFLFYLSLEFWATTLEFEKSLWIMFLPSVLSIALAEISSLAVKIFGFKKTKEAVEVNSVGMVESAEESVLEAEEDRTVSYKTKELSLYAIMSFLLLLGFWAYMIANYM
jgi:hypothetical protein